MIRPSPTSISLSTKDLSRHLQQIDVRHGLLKQGFSRKDIERYFREQQEATTRNTQRAENNGYANTLGDTELVDRVCKHEHTKLQGTVRVVGLEGLSVSDTPFCRSGLEPSNSTPKSLCSELSNKFSTVDKSTVNYEPCVPSAGPTIGCHVPRQSSLLKYASELSPDKREDTCTAASTPSLSRTQIRYEPCTKISSSGQATVSDDNSTLSSLETVFQDLTIDESLVTMTTAVSKESRLRGDADEFTPLSHLASITVEDTYDALEQSPSVHDHDTPYLVSSSTVHIVPALQVGSSVQSSRTAEDVITSSPSVNSYTHLGRSSAQPSSPTLPPMASTPRSPWSLRGISRAQAEPRNIQPRFLDGPSFTPYNDAVPASMQPQTPADLVRQPRVDESNAMYTAPPGRLRNDTMRTRLDDDANTDTGQQSPTNRAIAIRRRRNREYARSARIEGLRISRLSRGVRLDRDVGLDQPSQLNGPRNGDEQFDLWRDDLDADRVGEENFEEIEAAVEDPTAGVRVVSGNRRASFRAI